MQVEYILLAGIIIIILFLNFRENLQNTLQINDKGTAQKDITNFVICKNCKSWNDRDAHSKCSRVCKTKYPDKNISFTGNWSKVNDDNDISCECSFPGTLQKKYVGCPSGKSLDDKKCFIWNKTEADNVCQTMCNKFLPDSYPKWTGNWKSTSAETSACECEYYN